MRTITSIAGISRLYAHTVDFKTKLCLSSTRRAFLFKSSLNATFVNNNSKITCFPYYYGNNLGSRFYSSRPSNFREKSKEMEEIEHRIINANGINMHVAEKGKGLLILFLHGFPELWYSWRHQINAFASLGYRAVAPDLRGYGDTDAPTPVAGSGGYTILNVVGDLIALLDVVAPDQDKVFVVGHDWGALIAWWLCLFRPDRVKALVNMSVVFSPRNPNRKPRETLRAIYGDDYYICRFQEPGVIEAEFKELGYERVLKGSSSSSVVTLTGFSSNNFWAVTTGTGGGREGSEQSRAWPQGTLRPSSLGSKTSFSSSSSGFQTSADGRRMNSLTLKPSSFVFQSSSTVLSSCNKTKQWLPSVGIPRRIKSNTRLGLRIEAYDSSKSDGASKPNGDSKPPNGSLKNQQPKTRRDILLEYVKNVQPEFMELFVKRAPQQVVEAMRQTVTNMIGTLPPQFFAVTVSTVAENLAQLMYSVMMTGYMFKNAQYRLELQQSLEQAALPEVQEKKDVPDYAPGTQKNVSGEVIRWNNVSGPEKIDAKKYIELLEAEIEELNRQVGRNSAHGANELLEYLKSLEPQNLKELTSSAGEDVVFAMNTFIKRLLAVSDPDQMKASVTETSAPELAKLLYWLMVVGYSIRNIEVRFDMERVLGTPPKLAELPPGENI